MSKEKTERLWRRSVPAFRGEAKERTWIYRVAFNTALAWNRSEKKRKQNHESFLKFELPATSRHTDSTHEQEMVDRLYAAIRALRLTRQN